MKKKLIILVIVALIACAVVIVSVLFLGKREDTYRIVALPNLPGLSVADYKDSALNLYDNGSFDVQIVYQNNNQFAGVGTYKKQGSTYEFTYLDSSDGTLFGVYQIQNNKIIFVWASKTYTFGK